MIESWQLAVGEYYVRGTSEYQIQSIDVEKDLLTYVENPEGGYQLGRTGIQEFADRMEREGRK